MPNRANNLDTLLMSLEMLKRIPRMGKISALSGRDKARETLMKLGFPLR